MANPLGIATLTDAGVTLLAESIGGGTQVVTKYYHFIEEYYVIDSTMIASDLPTYWKEKDIDLYQMVDENTIEFVMVTDATDADFDVQTIGIYTEDGTLFAVANPSYPISKAQRQVAKIQLSFAGLGQALNFMYIAHTETEQDISLLNSIATNGNQILKNTLTLKSVKIQGVN